jgi:ubiquinone/menaquinone biosynthesis C-methylase UbiE
MKKYLNNNFDYGEIVNVYDELPLWAAPFGLKLLNAVRYKANITALDIGFGTGFPLTEIAMRLGDGSTVYGIDPWTEAIERTQQKLRYYGINNVELINGVAENIPLEDNSVDLIVSNNGINNVSDIGKALSECSRIMKSGGQFVMTMNTAKSMFEFYDALKAVLLEYGLEKNVEAMYEHIRHRRPPVDEVKSLLHDKGFIIKDLEYEQFDMRFADATAMLNHYFVRLAFIDSWADIVPKDKIEVIFNKTEDLLNAQAAQTGGLSLSIPFVVFNLIKK